MSDSSSLIGTEGPKHGDRGSGSHASLQRFPGVIAVSRQPGSRGGRLANHLAKKCGYTLFEREALEFLSRDAGRLAEIVNELDPASEAWVEAQLNKASEGFGHFDEIGNLSRAILSLAAQGGVVFLGRGAGFLLPRETTLHVRVVADHADRERYLAQWLRLPAEQAKHALAEADRRREDFLHRHFGRSFADPVSYDVTLNTSRLGEEGANLLGHQALLCRFPAQIAARGTS